MSGKIYSLEGIILKLCEVKVIRADGVSGGEVIRLMGAAKVMEARGPENSQETIDRAEIMVEEGSCIRLQSQHRNYVWWIYAKSPGMSPFTFYLIRH